MVYDYGLFSDDSRVYHSAVKGLKVEYDWLGNGSDMKYQELDDYELSRLHASLSSVSESPPEAVSHVYG